MRAKLPGTAHRKEAYIQVDGTRHSLGRWDTPKQAALARDRARLFFFGRDAVLEHGRAARARGAASPETLRAEARRAFRVTSHLRPRARRTTAKSRFRGVAWDARRSRWVAELRLRGEHYFLGRFATEREAARVVDRLLRHLGETALLNLPDEHAPAASADELRRERVAARRRQKTSKYIGVVHDGGDGARPWHFYIFASGEGLHAAVGGYPNEKDAAIARDRAALHYHDAPQLNFPDLARRLRPADLDTLRREIHRIRKETTSTPYRGVYLNRRSGRFVASIMRDRRDHHLGTFDDPIDAALAYDRAAASFDGDDRALNFPDGPPPAYVTPRAPRSARRAPPATPRARARR